MNAKSQIRRRSARCGLAIALAMALTFAAAPVQACGCGVVLPHEGNIDVTQERAIIRWDGHTEDIIMALQAQGNAKEAAWIMPVPSPAQVKLGDPKMFEFLQEFTRPRIEHKTVTVDHPLPTFASAPVAAAATLLDRREIGLYDVSTLAATDAAALTEWLNTNGYKFPDAAAHVLQAYVDQGWYYIAARISPGKTSQVQGELDPLWLTFKSDRLVYPMRPTALARNPLRVYLYILADHRMTVPDLRTSFAGWISPKDLQAGTYPIQQVVDRKYFLTKVERSIDNPDTEIKDDYFASQIPDDEYRDVTQVVDYVYVPPPASPEPAPSPGPLEGSSVMLLLGGSFALLLAVVAIVLVRKGRKGGTQG